VHAVIKQYRDARKIMLNIEQRLMIKMAPDYQHLTLIQKVEVFQNLLSATDGHDLRKALWLKSPSAELWLERRINLTRSLSVMSMVGYILGLGDRHPCNFMIDRVSGTIVHIDFGDCFEVAMHREKYPEKIPFRLTRMLVHAMEVSGIDGTFRATCETVMCVLRKNKNSVMAVLEAFVHDPLINWRLLETANRDDKQKPTAAAAAAATPNGNKAAKQGSGAAAAPADDEHKEGTGTARGVPEGAPAALPHGAHGHGGGHGHRMHEVVVGSAVSHALLAERRRSVVEMEQQADAMAAAAPSAAGGGGAAGVAGSVVGQAVVGVVAATASVANEQLNRKAVAVIARVESKLKGTDFMDSTGPANQHVLDVPGQVQRLIVEATSHINLCQSYVSISHAHALSCTYNDTHALLRGTGCGQAVPAEWSTHCLVSNVLRCCSICFFFL
jgi:FKBP12-rapamycin complex-associated protein